MNNKSNYCKTTFWIVILSVSILCTACSNNPSIALPEESPFENAGADVAPTTPSEQEETDSNTQEAELQPSPTETLVAEEPVEVEPTQAAAQEAQVDNNESEAQAEAQPTSPPEPPQFVQRQGNRLYLNEEPFRFVGTNAFFLQPEMAYGKREVVVETLDKAVAAGFNVIRMWGFNDKELSIDPAAIQTAPGQFSEGSLWALDRVIVLAKERDLKVILPLVNNWQDYGGIPRYLEWCDCGAEHGDFYTNETMKAWYRDYVQMLLTRVNTETGIAYRDEPTILAWELGNELRNRGGDAATLLAWHAEMAAFIKNIDPNHLIADGGEGFDDNPSLYTGLSNNYPVRGSEGASYHRLAEIPEIDMLSYHFYPEHWGMDPTIDGPAWIRDHEALARQAGKVAYFGEFGMTGSDAARAALFRSWLQTAMVEQESSGALVWNLVYDARPNSDGFNIYCPADVETCAVLQQ